MAKKRRRVALNLNNAQLVRVGSFLCSCGCSGQLGAAGRYSYAQAREKWRLMDSVARAAVRRLGLVPDLTLRGLIPLDEQ